MMPGHHVEADADVVGRSTMQTTANDAVMQPRLPGCFDTKVSAADPLMKDSEQGWARRQARGTLPSAPHRSLYFVHVMQ